MTYPDLPDEDALLLGLLRDVLGPGYTVAAEVPAGLLDLLPAVVVESRGDEGDPRFGGLVTVDVTCWAGDSRSGCKALARRVGRELFLAVRRQTVRPEGHLSSYSLRAGPVAVPSGRTAVWRYLATYQLGTRPPAA
jgi:hypothetical protein